MVSPTPLLERRPKNRALATAFGQNGRPGHGRRANQTGSAVAGRRLASRRAVRPSRAAWATVAASRGPSGARRSSRSGEPPRFGAGARGGGSEPAFAPRRPDELRVALRARPHGPAPAGHPAVRDNPIETLRSPALGRGAVPAPPLQLPRVVDERSRPGSRAGSKKTPQNPTRAASKVLPNEGRCVWTVRSKTRRT